MLLLIMASEVKGERRQCRVACIGDSLTAGFGSMTPYSEVLLSRSVGSAVEFTAADNYGECGATSLRILSVVKHTLQRGSSTVPPYDAFVFLAGTNDLGHCISPTIVLHNVFKMCALALGLLHMSDLSSDDDDDCPAGEKPGDDCARPSTVVVVVTVPPLGQKFFSPYTEEKMQSRTFHEVVASRLWLNQRLSDLVAGLNNVAGQRVAELVDYSHACSTPIDVSVSCSAPVSGDLPASLTEPYFASLESEIRSCARFSEMMEVINSVSEAPCRTSSDDETAIKAGGRVAVNVMRADLDCGDGLHLNTDGYTLLGNLVHAALTSLLV